MRDRFEPLMRPCEAGIAHVSVSRNSGEPGPLRVIADQSGAKAAGVSSCSELWGR